MILRRKLSILLTTASLSLSALGIASAQHYRMDTSHSMTQSLSGHTHHNNIQKRSLNQLSHVMPKGGAHHHSSGALSYSVDCAACLSTTQVQFRKNSTQLVGHSYDFLYQLAEALSCPSLNHSKFVIEGHASAEGSTYANLALSQRRANAIFDFLVSQGVCPLRLYAVGHGEQEARHSSSAPEYLRASDRRVVVYKMSH